MGSLGGRVLNQKYWASPSASSSRCFGISPSEHAPPILQSVSRAKTEPARACSTCMRFASESPASSSPTPSHHHHGAHLPRLLLQMIYTTRIQNAPFAYLGAPMGCQSVVLSIHMAKTRHSGRIFKRKTARKRPVPRPNPD